eukprot:2176741-Rhodomonas_salina.1
MRDGCTSSHCLRCFSSSFSFILLYFEPPEAILPPLKPRPRLPLAASSPRRSLESHPAAKSLRETTVPVRSEPRLCFYVFDSADRPTAPPSPAPALSLTPAAAALRLLTSLAVLPHA